MVTRRAGKHVYSITVNHPDGRRATLSTGTKDPRVAADVARFYQSLRARERWSIVGMLIDKTVTLRGLYAADLDGRMMEVIADALAAKNDPDVTPLLADWQAWKQKGRKGAASIDTYLTQIRVLYPEGVPILRSQLSLVTITAKLDALPVAGPTKNRYRAAISGFVKYLVRRGVMDTNVVRDVEGFGEHEPRVVYYERADAQKLLAGLPMLEAGAIALMGGWCAEWGAVQRFIRRDLDQKAAVRLRGTKTRWRDRTVPLVAENQWYLPYVERAVRGALPDATPFAHLHETDILRLQRKTATALKIVAIGEGEFGKHTLHDWRHTHTVQLLRDGYTMQIAGAHLGHKGIDVASRVYGRWILNAHDYATKTTSQATHPTQAVSK